MDLTAFLTTYKDFGIAGILIAVVWLFYRDLKATRAEDLKTIERVTESTDKNTSALQVLTAQSSLQDTAIQHNTEKLDEYLAYQRGRDGVKPT